MELQTGILKTRIARRILLLFVLCALVPTTALAIVSWTSVRDQLRSQSRARLGEVSKNAGMVVVERLQFLDERLSGLEPRPPGTLRAPPGFVAVGRGYPGENFRPLDGSFPPLDPLVPDEEAFLETDKPLVRVLTGPDLATPELVLVRASPGDAEAGPLWGLVDREFLWRTAEGYASLPTTAGLCIVTEQAVPLHCTVPAEDAFLAALRSAMDGDSGETFEWETPSGEGYIAGHWEVFLRSAFGAPSFFVGVTEARDEVMAPVASFQNSFLGVTVLGLIVVALLGNVQVRKSLDPVEELREATRRIADQDFDTRVTVESGDEFEELGDAFNTMARRIGSQFSALDTIGQMDRAILSALQPQRMAQSILRALPEIVPADRVALAFIDRDDPSTGSLHFRITGQENVGEERRIRLTDRERRRLEENTHHFTIEPGDPVPDYLRDEITEDTGSSAGLVAPFFVEGELAGFVAVAHEWAPSYEEDEVERLRQVADQTAVALSNARLLEELERLNWGSLTALARAIDAKSPWTAGHSERVRELTGRIAGAMGMKEDELERLERGALVHDIGKIGIPGRILDKTGALTPDEIEAVRSHPRIGARILEPIPALDPIIPMVLYHHERWDGSGYPEGLRGEDIPLAARVLGAADTYDALVSDRPYRGGLHHRAAVQYVVDGAGQLFDPRVVEAFRVVARDMSGEGGRMSGATA